MYATQLPLDGRERSLIITALAYMEKNYLERANDYRDSLNPTKLQLVENSKRCHELRLKIIHTAPTRVAEQAS